VKRRDFLVAATIAAAAGRRVGSASTPADSTQPVRQTPLRTRRFGPLYYDEAEQKELADVLASRQPFRWYGDSKEAPAKVLTFEREFAARMQVRYALAVTSGSAALTTALAALGVGPGDEVILPAWTWYSCYNAVIHCGALPVFAEIDDSLNIDPTDIEAKITRETKVIMAVHLLGVPCDMDPILALARRRGVKVLEDCAQAVGGSYKGRPLGSLGDINIYSLQLAKTISAGEGGVVVTNDPALFERAARYHDLGILRPPHEKMLGGARDGMLPGNQYRMNEFTGGVLLAQLRKLDRIVADIRAVARRVHEGVRDLPGLGLRRIPDPEGELGSSVFLRLRSKDERDRFVRAMDKENVPARPPSGSVVLPVQPHIEQKVTVHPAWPSFASERGRSIRYGPACCPRTIEILDRLAGVSLDPKFTRRDTDDIVAAIRRSKSKIESKN
jgi:8-amino-3,8-dideoxy-alpha-D-manno-octulosonate transaminase